MKFKTIETLFSKMPFDIQLFADGDEGGDAGNDGGADDGGDGDDDDGIDAADEKKYSDNDVNRIVAKKLARAQREADKKAKEAAEAEKLKNLSAAEKRDREFEDMKARLAELEGQKLESEMTNSAMDILKESGINVSSKLVKKLIADSAEETKANVDEFVTLFNAAVAKGVKAAMRTNGGSPKKQGGGADTWTKEKIMAVKDFVQRQKLIQEHLDLFK